MTTSHDERPALTEGASPDAAVKRGDALSRGAALWERVQALIPHAGSWWDRNRGIAQLAGPAAAYLAVVGALLMGSWGLLAALLASVLLVRSGPNISAETMLSLYRAQPIAPRQGAALRAALGTLSSRAELPNAPAIAIIPSMAVGAFSAGHDPRTAILMTEGLLRRYSLREIVAIVGHEIAHIKAGDLPFFALADAMTRLAQVLAYLGVTLFFFQGLGWLIGEHFLSWWPVVLLLLAPSLNSQLQLGLSRQREFDADRMASSLLGDTEQISALSLAMAPDFGSPLDDFRLPVPQRRSPIPSPVRAHLAGSIRAERLREGAPPLLHPPLSITDEPLVSLVGAGPIEMRPRDRWPGLWF